MIKRIIAITFCALMLLGLLPTTAFAAQNTQDIVILYENDVHCTIEGYSKLSALKKELQQTHAYVGVVSGGDFAQGNSIGVVSRGQYIVEVMNLVGYDAVTLGNHEFDYRMARLEELVDMMATKPVSCNFQKIGEDASYFDPYTIVSYGDVDIAYVGVTTPSALTSAAPAQFKDENGEFLYTFNSSTLHQLVQTNIDAAKAEGADYVILLSHIGYAAGEAYEGLSDIVDLIQNTSGLSVVLDAHSHSVIEGMRIADKSGAEVLLSSTGTKFEHIGKLTISQGTFHTELIKTADYSLTDPVLDAQLEKIMAEYSVLGERVVASSEVDLVVQNENGERLVRMSETNLGDLCADAFRYMTGADIGYINGGNLRANLNAGEITYNDLLNVLPFNNTVVLAEVDGQTILDMMEMALMSWPQENGSFPHLSGLTFSVNTAIESSVELNEMEEFAGVSGQYRVYNVKVFNRERGKYEPLKLDKTYTIAASNYFLLECGSGMKMLSEAKILQNDGILDVEVLTSYIAEELDGVIGTQYLNATANVTFTDGEVSSWDGSTVVWISVGVVGAAAICLVVVLLTKKKAAA